MRRRFYVKQVYNDDLIGDDGKPRGVVYTWEIFDRAMERDGGSYCVQICETRARAWAIARELNEQALRDDDPR